jgi:hypothetical protein
LREGSAIEDSSPKPHRRRQQRNESARSDEGNIARFFWINHQWCLPTDTSELIKYAANAFPGYQDNFHQRDRRPLRASAPMSGSRRGIIAIIVLVPNFSASPVRRSCFPKDTFALVKTAGNYGSRSSSQP